MIDKNKEELFSEGKTFCMYPWVHLHTQPTAVAAPCCIAKSCETYTGVGNAKTQRLMELVNSPKMSQLRLDMLNGVKNEECERCHFHEEKGIQSSRHFANREFGHYFDEAMSYTNDDGSLSTFKMLYFDVRFSNICNFKCRTCGQEFSSQWEYENIKSNVSYAQSFPKNTNKNFLEDILNQIDFMEVAYFAGGEPLITEEHYILLEEMIKRKRTNIRLRYNSNMSNLKFKDKDLLSLWKHFKNPIDIYASIDHVKERAEYIRNGTNWATVEENFHKVKNTENISLQINTVLSVFNYLTIDEFYKYLLDTNMYSKHSRVSTLYVATTPWHISPQLLPTQYKAKGQAAIDRAVQYMKDKDFHHSKIDQLTATNSVIYSKHTWSEHGENFIKEVKRLDSLRNERFEKVFPELERLLVPTRRIEIPV